jgi:ribosomal-protein-serine acetyltransferase
MANEQQFHHIIDEDLELCLLDEDDAQALFDLTDQNREYLRQCLIWVDNIETISDAQRYIRSSLGQFVGNNGFQAGMWYR